MLKLYFHSTYSPSRTDSDASPRATPEALAVCIALRIVPYRHTIITHRTYSKRMLAQRS